MTHIAKYKRIILIPVFLLLLLAFLLFFAIQNEKKEIAKLPFQDIDISQIADGIYHGTAKTSLIQVDVIATIRHHTIHNIMITRHENGRGKPAEVIINTMKERNSLNIDAISGATASSEVIKRAVYHALTQ